MEFCDGLERDIEQRNHLLEDLMASYLQEMEKGSLPNGEKEISYD